MISLKKKLLMAGGIARPGQVAFTTPGTYQFRVPAGHRMISGFALGGGAGGMSCNTNTDGRVRGGAGGGSAWGNIPVTPGEILTIEVGEGGLHKNIASSDTTSFNNQGSRSCIFRGTVILLEGGGTRVGPTIVNNNSASLGGLSTGSARQGGGTGGNGGLSGGTSGGGGAAGYTGNGGNGIGGNQSSGDITPGQGGGGGGGRGGSGGGGVGLLGQGPNGAAGQIVGESGTNGKAGSLGQDGSLPQASNNIVGKGGNFGGGGGARSASNLQTGGDGGNGAVRIIWGKDRAFPATNTGDV